MLYISTDGYSGTSMVKTEHSIIFVCNSFTWEGGWLGKLLAQCPSSTLFSHFFFFFFLSSLVNRKYEI